MIAPLGAFGCAACCGIRVNRTPVMARRTRRGCVLRDDWRRQFGARTPLLLVQLASYGQPPVAPADSGWAQVRESQRRVAAEDAQSGLAIAIDIGDAYDIHPPNKQGSAPPGARGPPGGVRREGSGTVRGRGRSPPCGRPRPSPLRSRMSKARSPRPAHCVRSALNCARPGAMRTTASTPKPNWMRAGSCCAARGRRTQRTSVLLGRWPGVHAARSQRAPAGPFELPIAEAEARR